MEFVIFGNDSRRFRCSVRGVYGTVYNQKNEGICVPIAMATATTISYILKYGYVIDLSPQPFIDLGVHNFRDAQLLITDKKYALQQHCDYQFVHIRGKVRYQTGHRYTLYDAKPVVGYKQIRDAIIENFGQWGPKYGIVAFVSMDGFVHNRERPYRNRNRNRNLQDVVPSKEEDLMERRVGHAVVITGVDTSSPYDEEHSVEIKNSYGPDWGDGGFSTVTYHFFKLILVPVMRGDIEECKQHRHPLDVYTIDHPDSVNGVCFSADGHSLATVCDDGIVQIFELDDFSRESFRSRSINMRPGGYRPTGVVFVGDSSSSVVVAATHGTESYLHMFEENSTGRDFSSKWDKRMAHNGNISTLFGAVASHGGAEGISTIVSSDGMDIRIWRGETGKSLGMAGLQNKMACISPNGRFVAAASLNNVEVWKIVYSVNGTAEVTPFATLECSKETDDITWLCFSPDSERIITASKDGKVRMLHIDAHKEEPKILMEFPIPAKESKDSITSCYDRLCISPDGKILAVTQASVVQWLSIDTGEVLDTADKAHEGDITSISWSPIPHLIGDKWVNIVATSGVDQKVKLWASPTL